MARRVTLRRVDQRQQQKSDHAAEQKRQQHRQQLPHGHQQDDGQGQGGQQPEPALPVVRGKIGQCHRRLAPQRETRGGGAGKPFRQPFIQEEVYVTLLAMKSILSGRLLSRPTRLLARLLLPPAALLLLAAMLAGCSGDGSAAGAAIYDFPITLYQGAAAVGDSPAPRLSDLRGQPVVLNFWAGLCPPCRAEMPEFQSFADQYAGRALVVGVDLGPFFRLGSQQDAMRLLNELSVTYPAGYTDDANVVRELGVLGLPATFFINADGSLHRKWQGVLDGAKLAEITDAMLAR